MGGIGGMGGITGIGGIGGICVIGGKGPLFAPLTKATACPLLSLKKPLINRPKCLLPYVKTELLFINPKTCRPDKS